MIDPLIDQIQVLPGERQRLPFHGRSLMSGPLGMHDAGGRMRVGSLEHMRDLMNQHVREKLPGRALEPHPVPDIRM